MGNTEVTQTSGGPGRWWLPVLLVVIILVILAVAFLVTHPHVFGSSATSTPTPTPKPAATATPSPTGTPLVVTTTPAPSSTAPPAGTPTTGATVTSSGVTIGTITHRKSQIDSIQQKVNQGQPPYQYYLNPIKVVQTNLSTYGFASGQFTIVSPSSAQPTPTPYSNSIGLPQVRIIVKYQGKTYGVFLDQPVQQGAKGIWVIIAIRPCAGTSYCS